MLSFGRSRSDGVGNRSWLVKKSRVLTPARWVFISLKWESSISAMNETNRCKREVSCFLNAMATKERMPPDHVSNGAVGGTRVT